MRTQTELNEINENGMDCSVKYNLPLKHKLPSKISGVSMVNIEVLYYQ